MAAKESSMIKSIEILNLELSEKEKIIVDRICSFDEQDMREPAIRAVKTFGVEIGSIPDFSLFVFAYLFHIGDGRSVEHLYMGIASKRGVVNAANALVRRGWCWWDVPEVSNKEFGYDLYICDGKYKTWDYAR